jgi:hypothetical protein
MGPLIRPFRDPIDYFTDEWADWGGEGALPLSEYAIPLHNFLW